MVESYDYDSFGNLKRKGHKVKQPYTFTGREWDKEIGLYYYRARYYDPEAGRFISKDPILSPSAMGPFGSGNPSRQVVWQLPRLSNNPAALHPFSYVGNNPVNLTDPSGLVSTGTCIAATKAFVFLRCLGELALSPGPLNPALAVTSCGLCIYLANNLVYDPFTCGVCALSVAYYIPGIFECANRADNFKCENC